ncbi:MAG: GHKL domain-containing protein [Synergistaceae bacterium]|nr:GHKL domain-containing protein [Synergistaceae bacterium]
MNDLIDLCIDFFINFYEPINEFVFIVVVCCAIFRDRLRRSALRIAVEMSLLFIAVVAIFLFLAYRGSGEFWAIGVAAFMLAAFLYYYAKTVREGFQKLLFVSFVALHTASCLAPLIRAFAVAFGADKNFPVTVLINIAVYTLGGWAVLRWFAHPLRQVKSRDMKWLWSVPAVFYFISESFAFSSDYLSMRVIDTVHPVMFLIYLISSFAVCVLLLRVLDGVVKNVRLESETAAVNRQLAMQREQYERLMKNAENIKFMRHDMRHHLTLMGELARGAAKLEEYIQSLSEKLESAQEKTYCANYAVNAVTAHYIGMAESEGVSVEARLEVPENTGFVPAIDLCVVMGNLLENAVEACRRMKHGNKFIRVYSRIAGDRLSFAVVNSFDGLWRESGKEGVYLSLKTDEGEGVGLSSVRAVCEKHRGLVQYEIAGDVWKSSVLVHMEEE